MAGNSPYKTPKSSDFEEEEEYEEDEYEEDDDELNSEEEKSPDDLEIDVEDNIETDESLY